MFTPLRLVFRTLIVAFAAFSISSASAEPIDAALAARIEKALKSLTTWAADADVVNTVKAANAKGPGDMNNAKWTTLADADPAVQAITSNSLANKLRDWEKLDILNKLFVRDDKSNLVAGTNKALLFHNASRPQYKEPRTGKPWSDKEAKPDPTTQILSVQIAVPIMDGATVIGVMNAAVTAK